MYCGDWHNTDCTNVDTEPTVVIVDGPADCYECDLSDLPSKISEEYPDDCKPYFVEKERTEFDVAVGELAPRSVRHSRPRQLESGYG